jgi:CBS domain-containing protein
MVKAKDIMTLDVISVKKNAPIMQAINLLIRYDITGLPVVDDDMTLIGIVSEKDILELFYMQKDIKNKIVADYMTLSAVHFDQNDDLAKICDCLIENSFRRVPVTSNGKVVGIISRPDVIRFIAKMKDEAALAKET